MKAAADADASAAAVARRVERGAGQRERWCGESDSAADAAIQTLRTEVAR